ncbi:MAG: hypothetical protein B6U65_03390 [Candidatus Wolframiiraptor sp. EX4484-121]|nr:MAG: hypothetical protein B6U65_03390 [Candidatus Wolframiiraptor sp. EX4484-121]
MSGTFRDWDRSIERLVDRITREVSEEISKLVESAASPIRLATYITPSGYRRPVSETYVDGDEVVVVMELPAASKESIDLRVREREVEVDAGFSEELKKTVPKYSLFKSRGYRAVVPLPKDVDAERAKAAFRDGVLVVRIPVQKPKGVAVKVE